MGRILNSAWEIRPAPNLPIRGPAEATSKSHNQLVAKRAAPAAPFFFAFQKGAPTSPYDTPDRVAGRSASGCGCNCAASVDPANAVVDEWPPETTCAISSK